MPSELITERIDRTLVLTIAGPASRNALSQQVCTAGVESLNVAESDPELRCVVLRGAGAHFSAGSDMNVLLASAGPDPKPPRTPGETVATPGERLDALHQFIEALRVFPKPVIAAVEGTAAGSGFSLALGCDLIVAAEDARFSMTYGRAGLSPDGGCTWQLMQLLPRQFALQLLWLAESALSPRQLHAMGIVNWVTDTGNAFDEALKVAGKLSLMAPNVLASVKELVHGWPGCNLAEHLGAERAHFLQNLAEPNAREGLQAFFEKRPPRFR